MYDLFIKIKKISYLSFSFLAPFTDCLTASDQIGCQKQCNRSHDQCFKRCPCHDLCPDGCPCGLYQCEPSCESQVNQSFAQDCGEKCLETADDYIEECTADNSVKEAVVELFDFF